MHILTNEEVARAINVDPDFDDETLTGYAEAATSFIYEKTGYDFSKDSKIEPLAKQCARLYVRQLHYGSNGYNKDHDYTLGITGLIVDLQNIAIRKKAKENGRL